MIALDGPAVPSCPTKHPESGPCVDLSRGLLIPAVFGNLTLQTHGRMVVQGGHSGFEDIQLSGIIIQSGSSGRC